jgi:hypothetical protein
MTYRRHDRGSPNRVLWGRISQFQFLRGLHDRATVPEPPKASDGIAFRMSDCDAACGPTAGEIEAQAQERAERFKRDQLLPIMGWLTGAPG